MKIGVDIVEVDRLKNNEKLWGKLLTEKELVYVKKFKDSATHVAGFFAAKEAFAKAMGTGFSGFYLKDIEICHDEKNAPLLSLSNKVLSLFSEKPKKIDISISHEKHYAVAVVFIED
jgi:holo-[acyl-carrier protein] synthase